MRVLIVEDVPAEAELLRDWVAHHGHDPIVAASAEAALDSLAADSPDAVLLDIVLPGMSGLEFLKVLSARRLRLPVVAISGLASEDQVRQCLDLGALEFLPKPPTVDQLEVILTFLEAQLLAWRLTDDPRNANRRRSPRVKVSFDVTLEDLLGGHWRGQCVDLGSFGVKVRSAATTRPGATARLSFSPPDGDARISVLSVMVRNDPYGQAFAFINLTNWEFTRLKNIVDARLRPAS